MNPLQEVVSTWSWAWWFGASARCEVLRGAQRSTTVVYVDISALSYTGVLYEPFRTSDVRLCNAELHCWHVILREN